METKFIFIDSFYCGVVLDFDTILSEYQKAMLIYSDMCKFITGKNWMNLKAFYYPLLKCEKEYHSKYSHESSQNFLSNFFSIFCQLWWLWSRLGLGCDNSKSTHNICAFGWNKFFLVRLFQSSFFSWCLLLIWIYSLKSVDWGFCFLTNWNVFMELY